MRAKSACNDITNRFLVNDYVAIRERIDFLQKNAINRTYDTYLMEMCISYIDRDIKYNTNKVTPDDKDREALTNDFVALRKEVENLVSNKQLLKKS